MNVVRLEGASDFLKATEALRGNYPVKTNLISTIVESIAQGKRKYERCLWYVVFNEENICVGAAIRTAPFGYVLTPMVTSAVDALAVQIAAEDDDFPFVSGNELAVQSFVDAYTRLGSPGSTKSRKESEYELIYELGGSLLPHTCKEDDIALVPATIEHYELVLDWMTKFTIETGVFSPGLEDLSRALINGNRLKLLQRSDGQYVSMGGSNIVIEVGKRLSRIGPIFTPAEYRGHGYASAITYFISQCILAEGATPMLFTQAHNVTSNKIYKQLGFELHERCCRISYE